MTVVAAAREQAVERITAPFKGLTYFTEEDSEIFFGRKAERLLIATTLLASRFTVVYGESGVGKSSLLRAGAVHDLRERALGELAERGGGGPARHAPRFIPAVVSDWRDDPIAACDESIRAAAAGLVSGLPPGPFAGKRFDELLESWCRSTGATLLIVLDQFEEYLLYHQSDEDSIGAGLARAIARRDLSVRFMVSIREDALAKLDRYEGGIPTLFENFIRIEHLDKEAGEAAITGPIDRYNAGLEPGEERVEIEGELVEKVLAQIERDEPGVAAKSSPRAGGGARVETVFLQLVMERLWNEERKANSNVLKVATFDALGGAKQIVFAHLKDAMDDLTDDEQAIAAKAFGRLVTPSRQKIAYLPSDLATADDVAPAQMTSVLERLSQRRIVRPVAPPPDSAESRYEIFHDVLADPVLAWRARYEEERALRHADEQRRRAWFVAGAALVGLVIVATIAVFALVERSDARSQARTAHARELVANALTSLDDDPTASLRFALTAAQLEQAPREEDVLRNTLIHDHLRAVLRAEAPVAVASFNRSGSRLLVAGADGKVRIYRRGVTRPGHILDQGAPVHAASFSPDGRLVLTGGSDGTARLWLAASGALVRVLAAGGVVRSVSFARGSAVFLTATANGTLRLWRTRDGKQLRTIRQRTKKALIAAALDPAARIVATVNRDRFVRVYSLLGGQLAYTLPQKGFVGSVAFSPNGRFILTCGYEGTVRLWRGDTGRLVREFKGPLLAVSQAVFSPDGKLVAGASADGTARVWNVATGEQQAIMIGHGQTVTSVAFSPDGNALVSASSDDTARVWRTDGGKEVAVLAGHKAPVVAASFSPDGSSIVTASDDRTARIWDPSTDPMLRPIPTHSIGPVTALAFSPDGRRFVAAGKRIGVWQAAPVRLLRTFGGGSPALRAVFNRDGRLVVTVHADGKARVWDVSSGALLRMLAAPRPMTTVAFTPDGRILAGAGSNVFVWNSAHLDRTLKEVSNVTGLVVSRDGTLVAAASTDGVGRVWRLDGGPVLRRLVGHTAALTSIAFSSDGKLLVTASKDRTARIWDAAAGRPREVLRSAFGPVADAAFSPDGRWVVTAAPGTAPVSQTSTGRLLFYLRGHTKPLTAVAFGGPDGRLIVTAAKDRTLRSYACGVCGDVHELIALAQRRLASGG